MEKELHSIKPFRLDHLGLIRLNRLAWPDEKRMKIQVGGIEFTPQGFDTFGHPIISKDNFDYYKALKANTERRGESLIAMVEYDTQPFVIKREIYDSAEKIAESTATLDDFKKMLMQRKQAVFCGQTLNEFVVFNQYLLRSDGKVQFVHNVRSSVEADVLDLNDVQELTKEQEINVPGPEDRCCVCGKKFDMNTDIKNHTFTETDDVRKVHKSCYTNFKREVEHQLASQIIDAIYDGRPISQIRDGLDDEDGMVVWYTFFTNQGTISIRFKRKVIVLEWHDNFKPFNMNIFDDERVTKYDRGIHAWSKDDAIRYLMMAKRA